MAFFKKKRDLSSIATDAVVKSLGSEPLNNSTEAMVAWARDAMGDDFSDVHEFIVRYVALMGIGVGVTQSGMVAADLYDAAHSKEATHQEASEALMRGLAGVAKLLEKQTQAMTDALSPKG